MGVHNDIVSYIKGLVAGNVFADVTLVCEDGDTIKAHKVVLSIHSDFLREIIEQEEDTDLIIVPQLTFVSIKMMMDFLYSGIMTLTIGNLLEIGNVADVLGLGNVMNKLQPNTLDLNDDIKHNTVNSEYSDLCDIKYFQEDMLDIKEEVSIDTLETKKENIKMKRYPCDMCKFSTKRCDNLVRHQLTVHEGVKYFCDQCDFIGSQISNLRAHILVKHEGVKYPCTHCDNLYTKKTSLNSHVSAQHEGKTHTCKLCEFRSASTSYLKRHIKIDHEGLVFPCSHCKYVAKDRSNLRSHNMSQHENNVHHCKQCEYKSTTVRNVKNHTKIIHDGKRYECDQCEYKAR